nr:hypothetical protein Iba_chr13dCG1750 [Ipomoea batatas]
MTANVAGEVRTPGSITTTRQVVSCDAWVSRQLSGWLHFQISRKLLLLLQFRIWAAERVNIFTQPTFISQLLLFLLTSGAYSFPMMEPDFQVGNINHQYRQYSVFWNRL